MKKIGLAVIVLIALFVGVGLSLPKEYRVSRSIEVNASPAQVHALVGDLNKWTVWSPWKDADPSMEVQLGNVTTGVGATQTWVGSQGDGMLQFTRSSPMTGVAYDLSFNNESYHSKAAIDYVDDGEVTRVIWTMQGDVSHMPILGGFVALSMEKMAGPVFEHGLNKLKAALEAKS